VRARMAHGGGEPLMISVRVHHALIRARRPLPPGDSGAQQSWIDPPVFFGQPMALAYPSFTEAWQRFS
jgi:hypothetical protein